jgi:hypothetical protein
MRTRTRVLSFIAGCLIAAVIAYLAVAFGSGWWLLMPVVLLALIAVEVRKRILDRRALAAAEARELIDDSPA